MDLALTMTSILNFSMLDGEFSPTVFGHWYSLAANSTRYWMTLVFVSSYTIEHIGVE